MKKLILSPCGTSSLTNAVPNELRKKLTSITNVRKATDVDSETRNELQSFFTKRKDEIIQLTDKSEVKKASAELNGILTYFDKHGKNAQDVIQLLRTDTWLGEITSDIVATWLTSNGYSVAVHKVTDLQTADIIPFKLALAEMFQFVQELITEYRTAGYHIVFNLTGGFKSVNGFLQTIGNQFADEVVYIFESSSELLAIPGLPFSLNYEPLFTEKMDVIRKIQHHLRVTEEEKRGLELFLFETDDTVMLNDLGTVVWAQLKKKLYSKYVLNPLISRIRYSKDFLESAQTLAEDRLYTLNEKLDKLLHYMLTGDSLKSLSIKQIQGKPVQGSTHEFYAWSDRDARRVYCHYEDEILVLDQLGKHL